jgi:hypothetical protein
VVPRWTLRLLPESRMCKLNYGLQNSLRLEAG